MILCFKRSKRPIWFLINFIQSSMQYLTAIRSSRPLEIGVLEECNIYRKTPVLESLFRKVASLEACNFIKTRVQHRSFPLNNVRISSAKSRSGRGLSHQTADMGSCLTISHTHLPCLPSRSV